MTFSQKLKYILSEQNISQAELSRLTGINKSSICQYLSGKNIPSKKRQGVIATAIGMPEDYFGDSATYTHGDCWNHGRVTASTCTCYSAGYVFMGAGFAREKQEKTYLFY